MEKVEVIIILLILLSSFFAGYKEGLMELSGHGKLSDDKNSKNTWQHKWAWFPKGSVSNAFLKWQKIIDYDTPFKNYERRKNSKKRWYYLWIFTPKYQEAFVYSSTLFVFTTDFWHKQKLFRNLSITIMLLLLVLAPITVIYLKITIIAFAFSLFKLGWWYSYNYKREI